MVNPALDVLVADDEKPTVDVIAHYLGMDPRVRRVHRALSSKEALRVLYDERLDAAFLDIHMPGLSGLELARVIDRFSHPPAIIFVTADEDQALKAFELKAVDYPLKPVSQERLRQAVGRIGGSSPVATNESDVITVDSAGVSKVIRRSAVLYAEASGDYVRLHSASSDFLVRMAISTLEEQWADAGFIRIHRSYLVALRHIQEVQFGRTTGSVLVGNVRLPVSRRSAALVRRRLNATRVGPSALSSTPPGRGDGHEF
jgi:two-component system response regulator LytT